MALATDYDGTLARDGRVTEEAVSLLAQLKKSGRRLILVSGRELGDLKSVFDRLDLFDLAVLENGGLLYDPGTRREEVLAQGPPATLVELLQRRRVQPLSVGRVVLGTWEPHHVAVLEAIRELGLEHQVIFNKSAVMVLPAGVNKATGLLAALRVLGLSPHNVVGVGDAENDHAFLRECRCSVAVANALPSVKQAVDVVTTGTHAEGVMEVGNWLLQDDLEEVEAGIDRHHLLLGHSPDGGEVRLPPTGNLLVAGSSGAGKSTVTAALIERLLEGHYQFCIVDPEGDYEAIGTTSESVAAAHANTVVVGSPHSPPVLDEVIQVLTDPTQNGVVNMLAVPLDDRPSFLVQLMARLKALQGRYGRPHRVVLDEVHHVLPAERHGTPVLLTETQDLVMVTVDPETVAASALRLVRFVLLIGADPAGRLARFCRAAGLDHASPIEVDDLARGEAALWDGAHPDRPPVRFAVVHPTLRQRRHKRKYAQGELAEVDSFFFRGPHGRLNLQARNLIEFLQMGRGVDDETWAWHLHRGDFSRWFEHVINDRDLAAQARDVEENGDSLSRDESYGRIEEAITRIYTLPA